jgi:hypothetical protein
MIALLCFFLTLLASPFKSKSRLEAENAALRHQLIVLRRKVRGLVSTSRTGIACSWSSCIDGSIIFLVRRLVRSRRGRLKCQHVCKPRLGRVESDPCDGELLNAWLYSGKNDLLNPLAGDFWVSNPIINACRLMSPLWEEVNRTTAPSAAAYAPAPAIPPRPVLGYRRRLRRCLPSQAGTCAAVRNLPAA